MTKGNYVIQAENLFKSYKDGDRFTKILNGINISIPKNKIISIIGPSGSGKSTLLQILGLIDIPDSGFLNICGIDVDFNSESQKSYLRRSKLSFIYQSHNLIAELNILDNVAMPLLIHRNDLFKSRESALLELENVGLIDKKDYYPSQLSGGEKQKVSLARALISKPDCIFADEPTGNLDCISANHIMELFKNFNNRIGTTIIMVTHDLSLSKLADIKLLMQDGLLSNL